MNSLAISVCTFALAVTSFSLPLQGETLLQGETSAPGDAPDADRRRRNGFYVWQRHWTDQVDDAVRTEMTNGTHDLYFLGGELDFKGTNIFWHATEAPAKYLPQLFATAVLRLPVRSLENPPSTAAAVISRARALGASDVQLDVDVPVSKMNRYGELLKQIRRRWPSEAGDLRLGATFLPCHLSHPEMARILSAIDEPVIQLHGIDAPKKLDQKWGLMNREVAFRALKEARRLDARFKMALPSYAYVLTFHADGRFRRLYAEGLPEDHEMPPGTIRRIAAPDLELICDLIHSPHRLPVIWFRLPVRGSDRWCLDRETLLILERGGHPVPRIEFSVRHGDREGVLNLFACFRHQIPLEGRLADVDWGVNDADGEFFPMNGCRLADDTPFGKLPRALSVPPSPCGEPLRIATIITRINPHNISIKESMRTK